MKKILMIIAAAMTAVITGCKSIPTPESMTTTAYTVGIASGVVANQTKIDDTSRNVVIDIMNEVEMCVPQTNETFESAWMPIARNHTQKLFDEGKIDRGQYDLIISAFDVACKGIDYLVTVRFPKAHEYTELINAATHGFCDGFLSVFKPANVVAATHTSVAADKEALKYLNRYMNNK